MNLLGRFIVAALLALGPGAPSQARAQTKGLTMTQQHAIETTLQSLADAWNHHDMKAYGDQLTDDCNWVNIVGMHWRGKAEVIQAHTAYHQTMFHNVGMHPLTQQIEEIAPGVALAILTVRMDDFTTPNGHVEKDMHDCMTVVLVQRGDRWLIRSAHNTTINPAAQAFDPVKR